MRHCLLTLILFAPFVTMGQVPDPAESPDTPRNDTIFVDQEQIEAAELEQQAESADLFDGVSREQAKSLFETHLAAGQFDEAVDAAKYGLAFLESELGPDHVDLVPALNDLGNALLRNQQPQQALVQFERSADLLRDHRGLFTRELFQPLLGQGFEQQMVCEHELAVDSFRRG